MVVIRGPMCRGTKGNSESRSQEVSQSMVVIRGTKGSPRAAVIGNQQGRIQNTKGLGNWEKTNKQIITKQNRITRQDLDEELNLITTGNRTETED